MNKEWVQLGFLENLLAERTIGAVQAAIACRRVVQVRRAENGTYRFYAHVPLPKAVERALADGCDRAGDG